MSTEQTLVELKAAAYDCMAQIEMHQRRLAEINQMIMKEMQKGKGSDANDMEALVGTGRAVDDGPHPG